MRRLVWAFAGRTYHIVWTLMSRLKWKFQFKITTWPIGSWQWYAIRTNYPGNWTSWWLSSRNFKRCSPSLLHADSTEWYGVRWKRWWSYCSHLFRKYQTPCNRHVTPSLIRVCADSNININKNTGYQMSLSLYVLVLALSRCVAISIFH